MTRYILPAFFVLVLTLHVPVVFAEDAAPAESAAKEEAAKEESTAEEAKKEEASREEPATDEAKKDVAQEQEIPKGVKEHQQAAQDVFEQTKKIAADLSPEEQKHFFLVYNNYNLIGTVKMVQGDVGNAVQSCGRENPDLKDKMDARFAQWNEAINPIITESEANVNNMVIAQEYAKPNDIKKVFKGLDKTRKLANAQIEKTPVTTKDACEYLLETMDDTQENFAQLLRSTLMSAPQALPASEEPKQEEPQEKPREEKKAEEAKPGEDKAAVEPAAGEKPAEEAAAAESQEKTE